MRLKITKKLILFFAVLLISALPTVFTNTMGGYLPFIVLLLCGALSFLQLMLIKDSNWNPVEGAAYELKLENFKDTMVRARVLSFTRTGGELLVRLDVISSVKPILYIRTCTGVLGDSVSSLCVPNKALYTQDGMPGVVVVREGYQFFVPVNVVDKRDGMVYIAPIQQDSIYEGETVRLF